MGIVDDAGAAGRRTQNRTAAAIGKRIRDLISLLPTAPEGRESQAAGKGLLQGEASFHAFAFATGPLSRDLFTLPGNTRR